MPLWGSILGVFFREAFLEKFWDIFTRFWDIFTKYVFMHTWAYVCLLYTYMYTYVCMHVYTCYSESKFIICVCLNTPCFIHINWRCSGQSHANRCIFLIDTWTSIFHDFKHKPTWNIVIKPVCGPRVLPPFNFRANSVIVSPGFPRLKLAGRNDCTRLI